MDEKSLVGKIFAGGAIVLGILSGAAPAHAGPLLNTYLPEQLKMDVEYRYRLEYRNNFDFKKSVDDKDTFHLGRARVGITFNPVNEVGFFIQGQDSQIWETEIVNKTPFRNYMDIRQLYAQYEKKWDGEDVLVTKVLVRPGRQEFSYGAQRLLGAFNWSNVAQTFDGGKAVLAFQPYHLQVDLFGGEKTAIKSPEEADDFFDGSAREQIIGYYASAKAFNDTLLEQYLMRRKTNKNVAFGPAGSGELDDYTIGGRIKKSFPCGLDYEIEAAKQWGDFRGKDVAGMMTVALAGYTFKNMGWQPRAGFEFDYGSGDSDRTDGKMRTFDNLYPTNHLFYGYIDFISLQNLNNYRYQLSAKPMKKMKVQADLHMIYLDTVKDSYYSVGRTAVRTATRDVDSHLGNEVDLTGDYQFTDWLNVAIGYSHFFAGDYLRETGADDDANFFYLQTTFAI